MPGFAPYFSMLCTVTSMLLLYRTVPTSAASTPLDVFPIF
jgi:hypothetical protein